ncbi:molybdopterin-dependent oxidoreductase [Methylopila musalis]|uniref:Molybdopterin-dependent oxidoreductase n=1 Tax=Methylopila musalis TaxID=1134781 RepID=A0ABW3Z2Z2_9HYPH
MTDTAAYCTLCTSSCGVIYSVEDDRVTAVRANPEHPTGRSMCPKGRAAPELIDSAERLRHPMRRTRPKGDPDPGWERISWDEALDAIAAKVLAIRAESGAEAVAFGITTPSGTPMADSAPWVERFVLQFGSPNICYASELCNFHKEIVHGFTFGRGMPTPDYANSDLIVIWGHNPTNTFLAQASAIAEARKRGAKLIVVDPRETALAREADCWLRVRPGADAALAMGIANALIASGHYDRDFVTSWSNGPLLVREGDGALLRGSDLGLAPAEAAVFWDAAAGALSLFAPGAGARSLPRTAALSGRFTPTGADGAPIACRTAFDLYAQACERFTPEATSAHAWIDSDTILKAAELIGAARRISLHSWTGLEQHATATQSMRAVSCLYALTGCFETEGGNRAFGALPYRAVNGLDQLPQSQLDKAIGRAERPMGPAASGWISTHDLYRAITAAEPYRVRAYVSFGANLLLSQADTEAATAALRSLEFHVHADLYMNPTAEHADIVLPINTPWEREALRIGFDISPEAAEWVQFRPRLVSSRGESRSDADIVFALATRMGMDEAFFGGSLERGWDAMLAPLGLDVAGLRQTPDGVRVPLEHPTKTYVETGFATPTGLVELYSERMLQHGYAPLPAFADADLPPTSEEFPFVLSTAKSGYYCHTQQRGLSSLRRKAKEPTLEMAGVVARAKGIAARDWVEVTTQRGAARFRARINDALDPRVVIGDYGWWQACTALGQSDMPYRGERTSNYNSLIDAAASDPLSGSVPMRSSVCDIRRETRYGEQPQRWGGFRRLVVSRVEAEAEGVRRVHFAAEDGGALPEFESGQHVTLRFDTERDGPVTRSYSLVGDAGDPAPREYVICVRQARREAAPNAPSISAYIATELRPGEIVEAQAPSGTFLIPTAAARPVVLHAGGIGVTPFVTALETAAKAGSRSEFLLIYNNRDGAAHVFRDRIAALKRALPGLTVIDVYSRPRAEDVRGEHYDADGRLSAAMVPDGWLERRALHYLCGPEAMMASVTEALRARGVAPFDIFQETFRSPVVYRGRPGETFNVVFARSARSERWEPGCGPLLDFAETLGVALPSGCRVGQCENCTVRMIEGQVTHLHGGDHADADACIACQAVPASDLVLDA